METQWVPDVGKLYVRQVLSIAHSEMVLGYLVETEEGKSFKSLAVMEDFVAHKHFWGSQECIYGRSQYSESGNLIVRRYASDSDIVAFLKLWLDELCTIADWVAGVQRLEGILPAEKARIVKLASPFL